MSDIQDKINEILSNPEALRQVQSLGEQLGLGKAPVSETKKEEPKPDLSMLSALGSNGMSDDMMKSIAKILLGSVKSYILIYCLKKLCKMLDFVLNVRFCLFTIKVFHIIGIYHIQKKKYQEYIGYLIIMIF